MWPESGGMISDPEFLLFITLLSQPLGTRAEAGEGGQMGLTVTPILGLGRPRPVPPGRNKEPFLTCTKVLSGPEQ